MAVNQATLSLVKAFEGLRAKAYPDPATGGEPLTIGYGHTSAAGPPKVYKGLTITAAEAEAILARDLAKYEAHVDRLVTVPLNPNQRGALVSFCFNVGPGNLQSSTLLKLLNRGEYDLAAAQLPRWDKVAGKTMAGLTRRRKAEQALFLTPASGVAIPPPPDVEPIPTVPLPEPKGRVPIPAIIAVFILAALAVAFFLFLR